MPVTIPLIDLEQFLGRDLAARDSVVTQVRSACEDIGFLMVKGHGVSESLIDRVTAAGLAFFDRSEEQKRKFEKPSPRINRGFSAMRSRTVGRDRDNSLQASLQEGYAMGMMDPPDDPYFRSEQAGANFAPNIWPDAPADFQPAMRDYYAAMDSLSTTIMQVFARALDLPDAYFTNKMDRHISTLRLVHYPALDQAPSPGEQRAGAHTDTGTLTILHIDDSPKGLQVQTRKGEWIDVARAPGAFIINIGDMMMRWTNDRWISTLHRVVNPPIIDGRTRRRLSVVYFSQPNYDTLIECFPSCVDSKNPPRYAPITSGEHRLKRYAKTYGFDLPVAS